MHVPPSPTDPVPEPYREMISTALERLEQDPRDDLSRTTFPFESQYAYDGISKEQIDLYGNGTVAEERDMEQFERICDFVVENMPQDASAYDQYRYLAYFVSLCTDYDTRGTAGTLALTPYGAVMGGKSVCFGFSNCFLYLCEKADLWCRGVSGFAAYNGEPHSWNMVKLEDGTYYVDVTWCDGSGEIGTINWNSNFMLTESMLLETHNMSGDAVATGHIIYE